MFKPAPKPIYCLRDGNLGAISCLCFRTDGCIETLLSGGTNGNISVWNLKTFRISSVTKQHDGKGILWLGCYENQIFSQGRDGTIRVWDGNTMKQNDKINTTNIGLCKCAISESGTIVMPTDNTNELALKSTKNGGLILSNPNKNPYGLCMCVQVHDNSSSGCTVVAGYENGNLIQWDSRNGQTPLLDENIHKEPIMCLDFDVRKQRGASGSPEDEIGVWNLSPFRCERKQITNAGIASLRIRQDGRLLGAGGWDSRIRIFSWKSLKPLAVLDFHTKTIECVEFSRGVVGDYGIVMAAGSSDEKISLWNLYGNLSTEKC